MVNHTVSYAGLNKSVATRQIFDSNAKKLPDQFKMRGYKDKTLDAAMMKISQKPREELLNSTKEEKQRNHLLH